MALGSVTYQHGRMSVSVFDGITECHLPTWTHVCRAYLTALLSVTYQHGRMSVERI